MREFREDNLTDWAAALTYYAILSIFPALLVLVSILGLIGESATQPLLDNLDRGRPRARAGDRHERDPEPERAPGRGRGAVRSSASRRRCGRPPSYVGAFMRASNSIYEVEEGRPFWKLRPVQIAITLVMMVLLSIGAVAVVLTGRWPRRSAT